MTLHQAALSGNSSMVKTDIPYLCARIRGGSIQLIPSGELDRLRSFSNLPTFFQYLLKTPYKSHLKGEMIDVGDLAEFESCLFATYCDRIQRIRLLMEQSAPEYVYFVIGEWDMHHLRSLGRWIIQQGESAIVRQAYVPVGYCTRERYEEVIESKSLDTLLGLFRRWYPELESGWKTFMETSGKNEPQIREFELVLEKLHFKQLLSCAKKAHNRTDAVVIRQLAALFVDLSNLRTALRFLGRNLPDEEVRSLYLPGGSFPVQLFAVMMAADDIEQIYKSLPTGALSKAMDKGMLSFVNTGRSSVFERFFDEQRLKIKRKLACQYPVSLAVPVYYLARVRNELVNLRIIGRGVRYQFPAGKIQENLVYG